MSLSVVNNVASLIAQSNLNRTSSNLSSSLERLSSGLKINRGADGPAALVVSQQQRAQISGLQTAIDNSNTAVSLVQTGEGALNEISNLLNQVRGLAVSSANTGVNDSSALAANQTQIANALQTINQISGQTQFGSRKLLNGTAGFNGTTTTANLSFVKATGVSPPVGLSAVVVGTAAQKANFTAGLALPTLTAAENLTINGVTVALANGDAAAVTVAKINNFTTQTGVTAQLDGSGKLQLYSSNYGSASSITVQSDVASGAGSTNVGLASTTVTGVDAQGTIGGVAATGVGNTLSANGVVVSLANSATALVGNYTSTTGAVGSVNVTNQSLVFQIGANAGQTANVSFDKVDTSSLGIGASGSATANLASIDVRSSAGAQDAIRVVDQAIADVSSLRGRLGAFQSNTLQANTANLQTALENTTAAESTVRDTNYAQEIANYTRDQVQLQAGATALTNSNQIPQIITTLLRG